MSEYWKSTPSYWCKHCKIYVRDTKFEKTNHEATPRHQGNLKRFLRDLHRNHEKEEREKIRAKDEVARLNGVVNGSGPTASSSSSSNAAYTIPKPQATASQRKQQLAQLAEMGVSIPDEFRPDMAMVGEWQVTSEQIIEDGEETKLEALALGVRKRAAVEEEAAEARKRRWGTAIRTYPTETDDGDLDALLNNATRKGKGPAVKSEVESAVKIEIKEEPEVSEADNKPFQKAEDIKASGEFDGIKKESPTDEAMIPSSNVSASVKQEADEMAVPGVIFKKRKAKNIRQK